MKQGSADASDTGSSSGLSRLVGYIAITVVVCFVAGVVGETWFPAELIGDTGGNDFAGVAALVWALGAFVLCQIAAAAFEIYLFLRRRRR